MNDIIELIQKAEKLSEKENFISGLISIGLKPPFDFECSYLETVNFDNADLCGARFAGAALRNTSFYNSKLIDAIFVEANLENANLENANLENANLENANLENANLENANLENANLENANLENANLENANLENANVKNANVKNANLQGAKLQSADLPDTPQHPSADRVVQSDKPISWLTNFIDGSANNIIKEVCDVADKFHLSGKEKQQFKLEMEALLRKRDRELEHTLRKELEAKERVLIAELSQGDNYTKRARPTVVYFGLGLIFLNYCLIPSIQLLMGAQSLCPPGADTATCKLAGGIELPREFWWAWGGIVSIWGIGRSFEKAGATNRLIRATAGSQEKPAYVKAEEIRP